MSTILVTGGSGFLGSHCLLPLLQAGHQVRATIRNLDRERDVRAMLRHGGWEDAGGGRLTFFAADLSHDAGWKEAVDGCEYVLHVASPFPAGTPKHEDELIVPAREGALRVLRAARDASVRRVVLTSSFAAIGYGHPPQDAPFDETDWTELGSPDVQPYMKSKTLAERAAWDFVAREGGELELCVVNPVGIFGPVLGPDFSASIAIVQAMLKGAMRFCPRVYFGVVDVRDVADLYLRAMTDPAARGERFLAVAGETLSMLDVAKILRSGLKEQAKHVPRWQLPDWLVRLAAKRVPALRGAVPQLGKVRRSTADKARRLLGWNPRSNREAIPATGDSLVQLGLDQ